MSRLVRMSLLSEVLNPNSPTLLILPQYMSPSPGLSRAMMDGLCQELLPCVPNWVVLNQYSTVVTLSTEGGRRFTNSGRSGCGATAAMSTYLVVELGAAGPVNSSVLPNEGKALTLLISVARIPGP